MTDEEIRKRVFWAGATPSEEDKQEFINTLLKANEEVGLKNIAVIGGGINSTWFEFRNE
jgi:hypothetical protein